MSYNSIIHFDPTTLSDLRSQASRYIKSQAFHKWLEMLSPGKYGLEARHLHILSDLEQFFACMVYLERELPNYSEKNEDYLAGLNLLSALLACRFTSQQLESLIETPIVTKGSLKHSWVADRSHQGADVFFSRILGEITSFVDYHHSYDTNKKASDPLIEQIIQSFSAFFQLVGNRLQELLESQAYLPTTESIFRLPIKIKDLAFKGFQPQEGHSSSDDGPSSKKLLDIHIDDIVGNKDFIQAGLRLARDVAGYDLEAKENPKTFNPILFALGAPGCGKTVTAHAVGNYFLNFCQNHNIESDFVVIRRSDWASSYQNASAQQLIEIFKERVYGHPGVVGVYWPDIDTAFSSRSDSGLRSEESSILGASFALFDGTMIPKDGKWFLICDANTLDMDEATVSRISQDPFLLKGPESSRDFVQLIRDVKLKSFHQLLHIDDKQWDEIGTQCQQLGFSGRNVDSICRSIITRLQDVEVPSKYYSMSLEEKKATLQKLARPLDYSVFHGILSDFAEFNQVAKEKSDRSRFENKVKELRLHLLAQHTVQESLKL